MIISLVIDNENDEIEIKNKFESLIKEHFIENLKIRIFITISENVRRLFHNYAEEKQLFHWTNKETKNFNLSNRDEDKPLYENSQKDYKFKQQSDLKQKQAKLDEKISNLSIGI